MMAADTHKWVQVALDPYALDEFRRWLRERRARLDPVLDQADTGGLPSFTVVAVPSWSEQRPSFTCPVCGRTSHHPEDVRYGYCGACHRFTGPQGGARHE